MAREENFVTPSLLPVCCADREDTTEPAWHLWVAVMRDPGVGLTAGSQEGERHGGLCCMLYSVADIKLPSSFHCQIYSFLSAHTSCLGGSCFKESSKEHIYSCCRSFPTVSFLNSSLASVKRRQELSPLFLQVCEHMNAHAALYLLLLFLFLVIFYHSCHVSLLLCQLRKEGREMEDEGNKVLSPTH